jgi:hypothetical protein
VTRSDWWASTAWAGATYIVAVDPPAAALGRAIVPGITVTEKQTPSLATVVLP